MRTLKTLAAFGVLLLAATSANAALTFSVTALNNGGAQEIDLTLTVSGGSGSNPDMPVMSIDWLLNGAAIPLSAVQLPGSVPGPGPNTTCANTNNQFMCAFSGGSAIGSSSSNDVGNDWAWSFAAPVPDGIYNLGRFTFTDVAGGNVSIGDCLILTSGSLSIPCQSNSAALNPIPEPTTAALIGLGLFGLVIGGGRRR